MVIRTMCVLYVVSMLALVSMAIAPAAGAQGADPEGPPPARDYVSCGHFENQADAQAFFDSREISNPEVLDGDGDGIACEDAFGEPEPIDCEDMPTLADAQWYFDTAEIADPCLMDPDGDGIPCEYIFGQVDAGAQEAVQPAPETTSLLVHSEYCATAEGNERPACEPAAGVTVTVTDTAGTVLGACVTEVNIVQDTTRGYCDVTVPVGTDVIATQDNGSLLPGYAPLENPVQVSIPAVGEDTPADFIPRAAFMNVPVAGESPANETPVEEAPEEAATVPGRAISLPNTGSGSTDSHNSMLTPSAGLILASGACLAIRKLVSR